VCKKSVQLHTDSLGPTFRTVVSEGGRAASCIGERQKTAEMGLTKKNDRTEFAPISPLGRFEEIERRKGEGSISFIRTGREIGSE